MKKILLPLFALASLQASAQVDMVDYRGAFAPAPVEPWTAGWTNFSPRTTEYPQVSPNGVIPKGNITVNTTLTNDRVWSLQEYVYVEAGVTLTIEPGTIIRSTGKSALIIKRGGRIMADGTPTQPIVFTSGNTAASRTYSDWAGVVICGNATHNAATGVNAPAEGDISAFHGGDNDDDNSGIFRYVRIEFPGQALSQATNSEINGLSLYSVGRGTIIDYVQVSFSGDDAFEWFGGTVNAKHLVAYRTWDDDFDSDLGYRGTVQFGVAHRDPAVADQSQSNGFESDNDGQGSDRTPQTAAKFYNMTIVGPMHAASAPANDLYRSAAHIRRNSATSIMNSILIGFKESGLKLDGRPTVTNFINGTMQFKNNFVANNGINFNLAANSDVAPLNAVADLQLMLTNEINGNVVGATSESAMLTMPFNFVQPDYRPIAGAQVLGLNDFSAANHEVKLYPNPAMNFVEVATSNSLPNGIVKIQNSLGAVLASQETENNLVKFDISDFANGFYIVSVTQGNKVVTKTLVVNK